MAENIFAEIKRRIDLPEIIKEDYPLAGRGNSYRGDRDDTSSLVVVRSRKNGGDWYYYWNSKSQGGDVFNYLKNERGMDTKTALEYAAKKAGVTLPEWTHRETKNWLQVRATEDVLSVAMRIFQKWHQNTPAMMEYSRGRGWSDETINNARLGFSGFATAAEFKEMRDTLIANNHDPESPAAVAILGFKGDVAKLKAKWERELDLKDAISNDDILNGYIPGFMGRPRLIYPHLYFQKVTYMSSRNLVRTEDGKLKSEPDKKKKSYNPRAELVGPRQPYFAWNYRADSQHIVIVEGQADVITLGQWNFNAFGQVGTALDDYWGSELSARHETRYYATDNDAAGKKAVRGEDGKFPIADLLGPLTQIVNWTLKDANDVRQWFVNKKITDEQQVEIIKRRINKAFTVAELAAKYAADQQKRKDRSTEEKISAMDRAFEIIAMMGRKKADQMLAKFIKAMGISTAEFRRNLKNALGDRGDETTDDSKPTDHKFIYGGWYPVEEGSTKGWLIDYLWDPQLMRATFAYRDPEGRIGKAAHLDIKGVRFYPKVDANIQAGGVLFPSDLGPEKPTNELLSWNELYMQRSFLLDNPLGYKLASYWAQHSWLYDCFDELSYFRAQGESDSGKSAIALRVGFVCYRLTKSSGVGSAAAFKHMQHMYRGTMFFDEIKDDLDEFDDRVVMLNIGAMKEQAFVPMMTAFKNADGSTEFEVVNFNVYGPKIATMYGKFPQDATEGRFLTIKTIKHELVELRNKNIPRRWSDEMRAQALYKRNLDITWRLKNWQPRLQPPDSLEDVKVSTRINQVVVPIKYILTMDPDKTRAQKALKEIDLVIQSLYEEQKFEKSQKTEARIIEAIDAIQYDQAFTILNFVQVTELDGWGTVKYVSYADLTKCVNYIIDEMNLGTGKSPSDVIKPGDDDADEEASKPKKGKKKYQATGVSASSIGRRSRDMRLPVHRMGRGFVVIIHSSLQPDAVQDRIELLKMRYGLDHLIRANGNGATPVPAPAAVEPSKTAPNEPEEPEEPPFQEELL